MSLFSSNMLYERRFGPFFVEPIVAGLDPKTGSPFICNMDLIGCVTKPNDFVVGGTADEQLLGMCETLWSPGMGPDELFEATAQALMNGVDRDASAGWGGVVHIIEKDKVRKEGKAVEQDACRSLAMNSKSIAILFE